MCSFDTFSYDLAAKADSYHIDTTNVLFILSGAFVGLDKIIKKRVAKGVCHLGLSYFV